MAIKLQDLVSELKLDKTGFDAAAKGAAIAIGAITTAVAGAALGIGKMVKGTFEWAAEMDGLQDIMGVTNKQAAALNFILHKSGVETDKLATGMTILEKNLIDAEGKLDSSGKKLAEFGINAFDANNQLKDQATLFKEISDKYNAYGTQTERVNLLTELFGKSGAGLIDVFDTLAQEGGLDKTTEKVEKLGLVIDPAKYEQFTRNLEEIKLAGLGLAITFVDALMPAVEGISRWWNNTGLPAFIAMRKWLGDNIPIVVNTTKQVFDRLGITWNTTIKPAADELIRLWNLLTEAGQRLSPNTGDVAGKFTILGATIRVVVGLGAAVATALEIMTNSLRVLNAVLSAAIGLWDRFRGSAIAGASAASSIPTPSGGATTGGRTARSGRANGGAVLAGHSYNILEQGRSEVFTPNTSGRMDTSMKVTLSDRDLERIGTSAGKSAARAIAPLTQRGLPA
jgi:hypothetical protein